MAWRWIGISLVVCLSGCGPKPDPLPGLDVQFAGLLKNETDTFIISGGPLASGAPPCTVDHSRNYGADKCSTVINNTTGKNYQIYTVASARGDCIKSVDDASGKLLPLGTTCPSKGKS